ncbi:kallikrein-1-like [Homalodisca vitripennis]|uniref:kallikrein-1-like n=1 Tax=Homalodisca vitripennis TaxID=197043 RepID=UPI001EEA7E84|nr:kallikrein-1-like [Homalodisca vitripennis]KAG8293034.1 Transgelin-3 [Homalodisca vitripennis]
MYMFLLLLFLSSSPRMCQPPGLNFMKYYEYPQVGVLKFAVLVRTKQEFCSGVLLSDSWVLTAAHCVVQDERSAGDTGVTVKAGVIDKMDISGRSQERTSSEVVVYPDFKEKMISKFDIALIKVTEPFDLTTDSVDIVGISNQSWPLEPNFFRTCVGFGFGNIPSVDRSEPQRENQMRLKMWTTTAVHNKEACPCTKRFHWRRLICLRETDEIELCQGDGGGGLVCFEGPNPFKGSDHKDSIKKAELFGIAHMTMDKYMCMVTREPTPGCAKIPTISAYMYLCPFKSWLANYVPGVAFNTVSCQGSKLLDAAETMVLVTFLSLQYLFLIYN